MIELLQTMQIAFFRFATRSGFLGGGGRRQGTKSIRARVRARENPMKPFVRTSFLGTRTLVSSLPWEAVFLPRRPKTEFMTGPHRQPSKKLSMARP